MSSGKKILINHERNNHTNVSRLLKFNQKTQYLMFFMSRNVRKEHKVTFDESWKNNFLNYLNISISSIFCSKLNQFLLCSGSIYFLQAEIQANGQYYHNWYYQWVLLQLAPFVLLANCGLSSLDEQGLPTDLIVSSIPDLFRANAIEGVNFNSDICNFLGTFCWSQWRLYSNQALILAISTQWKRIFKYHL